MLNKIKNWLHRFNILGRLDYFDFEDDQVWHRMAEITCDIREINQKSNAALVDTQILFKIAEGVNKRLDALENKKAPAKKKVVKKVTKKKK